MNTDEMWTVEKPSDIQSVVVTHTSGRYKEILNYLKQRLNGTGSLVSNLLRLQHVALITGEKPFMT
jgi:precorrin-6B methylase 2